VALRAPSGTPEHFETFLSHRGEEMGSIRGQVRVHVPADLRQRGTRPKIYGRCTVGATGPTRTPAPPLRPRPLLSLPAELPPPTASFLCNTSSIRLLGELPDCPLFRDSLPPLGPLLLLAASAWLSPDQMLPGGPSGYRGPEVIVCLTLQPAPPFLPAGQSLSRLL